MFCPTKVNSGDLKASALPTSCSSAPGVTPYFRAYDLHPPLIVNVSRETQPALLSRSRFTTPAPS
jgi:hypothetical protein